MFSFFVVLVVAVAASADPIPLRLPISRLGARIIGGENAAIETYPYQVSIFVGELGHVCGGSIISAHYVLTAAHCTWFMPALKHTIRAGSSLNNQGGSLHDIESFVSHEKHNLTEKGIPLFDIAVIRVKQPFHFDETRQPIDLMDKDVKPDSMATVTGWGKIHPTKPILPHQLQVVKLPIIDKKTCNNVYAEFAGSLPEAQICAGYLGGGKSACHGDSGGPLVVDGKLTGIVSWARSCGGPNDPTVFTEVAPFNDWIAKNAEL